MPPFRSRLPCPLPITLPPRPQCLHVDPLVVPKMSITRVIRQPFGPEVLHVSPDDWIRRFVEEGGDGRQRIGAVRVAHELKVVVGVSLVGDESAFHGGQYQVGGHLSCQLSAVSSQRFFPEYDCWFVKAFHPPLLWFIPRVGQPVPQKADG